MTKNEKIDRLIELKNQAKLLLLYDCIEKMVAAKAHFLAEVERINKQIDQLHLQLEDQHDKAA